MMEQALQKKREIELMNSEVMNMLKSHVDLGKVLNDKEWMTIEQTINNIYPDFVDKLSTINGMTEIKHHVCLLTKLHQRNTDIAVLVGRTPSAITRIKSRFVDDLGISSSDITFDDFIFSL